jgi:hypothetical protein
VTTRPSGRTARPSKAPASKPAPTSTPSGAVKRERRKITDPVILEKRRAALVKARKVRAANRAAAKGA